MELSKPAVGLIAAACIVAGAGGAFLTTRSEAPAPAVEAVDALNISPDPGLATVEQSEAIVTETPVEPVVSEAPVAPRPAPRRAATPAPRRTPVRTEPAPAIESQPVREEIRAAAPPPAPEPVAAPDPAPFRPAEPPAPQFEELIIAANSVIGLQVDTSISSETARLEDEVVARVTRDVRVGDRVAIPAGARAFGEVTMVERGGRVRERARLGIRFTSIVLADGSRVAIDSDTIYREGDAPGGESAAKIGGGAIGGAIIGGILGGARGAAIGGSVGAGAGTAAVLAGGRNPATLPSGTPVTIRVTEPTSVTVEQ